MTGPPPRSATGSSDDEPAPQRPARPVLVELASAMLVVSGVLSVLGTVDVLIRPEAIPAGAEALVAIVFVVDVLTVLVGVLVRFGRAWLLAINVVAVAGFLELTSATAQGLLFGAIDLFVLVALLRQRPWFERLRSPSP